MRTRSFERRNLTLALMTIPGLGYLLVNNYLPLFGLFIAFKEVDYSKGILGSDWVGLKNFEFLFSSPDALLITKNTVLYNLSFIAVNMTAGLVMAFLLNELRSGRARKLYQSVLLLPNLISMVIVSYLVYALLSAETGFVNKSVLPLFQVPEISWYAEPKRWPLILVLVNLWKGGGYLALIYYAAILGIDQEIYEAARIDGAGRLRQAFSITLPLLVPVIAMLTVFAVGRIFSSDFGLFYQVPLDSGSLIEATNVIDTYVYRGLIRLGDIGMSAAAGFYQSIVGFFLVLVLNYALKRASRENALF